jgi:hypothetical protein
LISGNLRPNSCGAPYKSESVATTTKRHIGMRLLKRPLTLSEEPVFLALALQEKLADALFCVVRFKPEHPPCRVFVVAIFILPGTLCCPIFGHVTLIY